MKSMTGYGEGAHAVQAGRIAVQVKSLNHRHLDLQVRVPREYLALEEEIRVLVRGKISRGRVEVYVTRVASKGQGRKVELEEELLGQYLLAIRRAKKKYQLGGDIGVGLFASLPDLFRVREVEGDAATEKRAVFAALETALKGLEVSREREGRRLKKDMQGQARELTKIAAELESRASEAGTRVQKPSSADGDENVAAVNGSDIAGWVLKGDINEEIVRLKSHVAALAALLREKAPVGKKIDFLLQEVQRELNTIGSKVPQLPFIQLVLQGKERVEKIREQTQNIE